MLNKTAFIPFISILLWGQPFLAQSLPLGESYSNQVGDKAQTPIPDYIAYQEFYKHLIFMEKTAKDFEARKENGTEIRNYYKQKIGLTDVEAAVLLRTAEEWREGALRRQSETEVYVNSQRTLLTSKVISVKERNNFNEWVAESVRKDIELIRSSIDVLSARLLRHVFDKVDFYVKHEFSQKITITPLPKSLNSMSEADSALTSNGGAR